MVEKRTRVGVGHSKRVLVQGAAGEDASSYLMKFVPRCTWFGHLGVVDNLLGCSVFAVLDLTTLPSHATKAGDLCTPS